MLSVIKAEFHCHTEYSHDSLVKVPRLLEACKSKEIDRIAITDHNTIKGALLAKKMDPERVIIGEEILTTEGEILGYFLMEQIKPGMSPMVTIQALKEQNAFISLAHPFDRARGQGWKTATLHEMLPHIDAIEVFNARCVHNLYNQEALNFANEHGLLKLTGSDAHSLLELGKGVVHLANFYDKTSLINALNNCELEQKKSGNWIHILSTYAKIHKKIFEQKRLN